MKKVGVVSLGCDKNRVDTENLLYFLNLGGYDIVPDPQDADILIVNTCAFILSAKEESIETIMEMAEFKKTGSCEKLIVTGCLPKRYQETLFSEMEEVDAFMGTEDYSFICEVIERTYADERVDAVGICKVPVDITDRILTTPPHYAYLRISDGCNNHCTYCAIPLIRGKMRSRSIESLTYEAEGLAIDGVKELNFVAQDVTAYGIDLYEKRCLIKLIKSVARIPEVKWIRLLYCYPERVSDNLIQEIKNNTKVCKYIDIPMQHIADGVLKRMGRKGDSQSYRELISKIRSEIPDIKIRSTFIVGFPGETEEDFNELKEFIAEGNIDYAGFFAYSKEEGTAAEKLPDQIAEEVKERRLAEIQEVSEGVMIEKARKMIGKKIKVLYEGIDYDKQMLVGRSQFSAPDIDPVVYIHANDELLEVGEFYDIQIVDTDGIDLIGEVLQ